MTSQKPRFLDYIHFHRINYNRCVKFIIIQVALKIVNRAALDEENLIRLEREMQILTRINHPHIVKLYEVGLPRHRAD